MAPRTIAERAAAGEIQSIEGLTREEQGELLVWARSQEIPYREIIRRYGFTQSENGLRGWHMQIVNNRPPRVATFTPEDDELVRRAVELFATGPLDDPKSFTGIWIAVRDYIRKNGATTTAGVTKLKARWEKIANQGGAAQPGPTRARLARSFSVPTGEVQPSSSAPPRTRRTGASTGNSSTNEGANADLTWGEYEPLSDDEMRKILGSDYAEQEENGNEKKEEETEAEVEDRAEDDGWGEYDPLSDDEMRKILGSDYSEEEEDAPEDDDYDEGKKPRGSRPRKG